MNKTLLTVFAFMLMFRLQAQDVPKRELRGVWISTHLSLDWPNRLHTPAQQRTALIAILDHNKATGINAVYFQVRSQSDAMYASNLEPWSYYLTNNQGTAPNPLWDPMQFAIEECHKRGLEFHAWINPYRAVANTATENNAAQYSAGHVSKTHPEWMLTVGSVKLLNPGLPLVRDHVAAVIEDIVTRYDVDGIHFDDYFYPSGTSGDDAAYNADPRGFPATTAGRADWRRDNVNLLISRVGNLINTNKPWVKFGVSPSGIYRSSTDPAIGSPTSAGALQHYSALYADSRKWIQSGWVDYLVPQVYWYIGQTGSDYKLLVPWWNNNAFGRHIYMGLADYKVNTAGWTSRSEIPNQVRLNRSQSDVYGQIHFRHAFQVANALNYRDSLKTRFYNKPALLPAMPWKDNVPPASASALNLAANADNSISLSWTKPDATSNQLDKARQFVVYRSENQDINLEDGINILAITNTDQNTYTDNTVTPGRTYYYTVTSLDRLHNESAGTNVVSNDKEKPVVITQNISRTLLNGAVSISAADIDNGSSDNWGLQSMTLSKSNFNCDDIGENTVVLTATDKAGNIDSATAIVTILGTIPQPLISLTRADNTFTGLPANTIALGYGAQSFTLTASDSQQNSESTVYSWNPAPNLSNSGSESATFTPDSAGTYTLSVQASNEFGCTATSSITVTVIDVRCDNDKVLVCNQSEGSPKSMNLLCISANAVPAHLQKGGRLGGCSDEIITAQETGKLNDALNKGSVLSSYPNPFTSQINVTFTLADSEKRVLLEIYDLNGNKLQTVYAGNAVANTTYNFPVEAGDFQGQFFNIRLVTPGKVYNFKLARQ